MVKQLSSIALPTFPLIAVGIFSEFFFISDIHEIFVTVLFLISQIIFLILTHHEIVNLTKNIILQIKAFFLSQSPDIKL
jgi:hypothetical protein